MQKSWEVHLVDASPYVFRAYFTLPESLVDRDGRTVNAVYGFAGFLLRYLAEEQPTHIGVAFDESLTTSFRNDLYTEYKAQRDLPPPELEAQLQSCQAVARALGIPTWADERYEADDLIGTLCHQLRRRGHRVRIVSPDKDLTQLVDEHVHLFDFAKGEHYGPDEVVAKFGVRPEQMTDYLGLAGDSVDNIPGVPRVGSKTAAALLEEFEGLEDLYGRLDDVAGLPIRGAASLARRLEEHRDLAFLSRELATIATDAPARANLRELRWRGADAALVDPLFEELDFGAIRDRIPAWR